MRISVPVGCFAVLLPLDLDYKVLGYYLKEAKNEFEIKDDLFLRLNLDHAKNEYNLLKLKDFRIFSYLHKFRGKLTRKASGVIIGLLLNEVEEAEKYRSSLKEGSEAIEILGLNIVNMEQAEFEPILREIYMEHLEPLTDILKPDALKDNVINITKIMLSGGKKERKTTQELLKKVEAGEHEKITDFYNTAENALKGLDHEKAAKFYKKAADIAEELYLVDVASTLNEKASFSQRVPDLSKQREKLVQEARNLLRNEDFHGAYTSYKKAGEISKKLVQFDKEEEYRLKAKALEDFYKVDEKFKKN